MFVNDAFLKQIQGSIARWEAGRPKLTRYIVLTSEQLEAIAGVGGLGLGGLGKLSGKLVQRGRKRYLVTFAEGSKSEVKFAITGKTPKSKLGKRVELTGVFNKTSPWGGTLDINPSIRA